MEKIKKFLRSLQPAYRLRIMKALAKIAENNLNDLDIVALKGKKNWFRCRIGKIRIIFMKTHNNTNVIFDIQFRGKIYKGINK